MRETLLLLIPTFAEVINDWNGETLKDKRQDVWMRAFLVLSVSVAYAVTWRGYLANVLLSTALFVLLFDYLINIVLRRPSWFSYMGSGPIDKAWTSWSPWLRLAIRVVVFLAALLFYLWT